MGRRLTLLALLAAVSLPAAAAMGAADRGDRGRSRDRGHSHSHSSARWGHRGHDHGFSRSSHWGHGSHHHSHRSSGLRVHIGLPPIVFGSYCDPVVVRERPVYVRERAYPVVVRESYPAPVIVSAPPPTVIVTQPAPQPVVVAPPTPPPAPRPVSIARPAADDVVPAELNISAYRSGGTVMVLISGANVGAYSTAAVASDLNAASPTVVLHNARLPGDASTVQTPFTANVSLSVPHAVSTVTVRVADRAYDVAVVEVAPLR